MILSVSRRTDIPAFHLSWWKARLQDGFVTVANPFRITQKKTVSLHPQDVDGIVFWSKNPAPLLNMLNEHADYAYVIQYTITPYGDDLEPCVPSVTASIETFRQLSDALGPHRVLLRVDPIAISPIYTVQMHVDAFDHIMSALAGYGNSVTISFLDMYTSIQKRLLAHHLRPPTHEEQIVLAAAFAPIARNNGFTLATCAEEIDLAVYGIQKGCCISGELLASIAKRPIAYERDKNQRPACRCHKSIDVGAYSTCPAGCIYCYANKKHVLDTLQE